MNNPKKTFVRQQGQSDCGVACLLSVLRYYGGDSSLETLRVESGTDRQGTSLLGLVQGAEKQGLNAEAFEAENLTVLKEFSAPIILQVLIDNRLVHYVVLYGVHLPSPLGKGRGWGKNNAPSKQGEARFLIGDPAKGMIEMTESELAKIWQSKMLVLIEPNEKFVSTSEDSKQKRKWLISLLEEDTNILIVSVLLGIILAVLGLATAIFSQQLIDKILPSQDTKKLVLGLVLLTFVLLARSGLGYLRGFMLTSQSRDFNTRLLNSFVANLLYLPKSFFDSRKTGELIARMNDSRRIQAVVSFLTGSFVTDLLVVLVFSIFIFTYSTPIASLVLLSVPFYGLLVWFFNKSIIGQQYQVMQTYAHNESHYINTLQGIDAVKANGKESFFVHLTQSIFSFFQEQIFKLGKIGLSYAWFSELIGLFLTISVIAFASFLVIDKALQIGEMVAVLSMSSNIFSSVNRLAVTNIQIREAQVVLARLFEFTKIKKESDFPSQINTLRLGKSDSNAGIFHLKAQHLCFRFAGRKPLFNNVSFEVSKGEMIAIIGENGTGKSILLQILQKFYTCESGQILVNEQPLENIAIQVWRSKLGVLPQEISLFNGNLLYNIALEEITQEKALSIIQFCKDLGINQLFEQFPQAYFTILGDSGIHISGGQKQLVGLARALFRKPQCLLLDEPTSAMDKHTAQFVIHLLQKLKKEMAILLITHKATQTEVADRVYELENGSLLLKYEINTPHSMA